MKIKKLTAVAVTVLLISVSVFILHTLYSSSKEVSFDLVVVNDITQTLAEHWGSPDQIRAAALP